MLLSTDFAIEWFLDSLFSCSDAQKETEEKHK